MGSARLRPEYEIGVVVRLGIFWRALHGEAVTVGEPGRGVFLGVGGVLVSMLVEIRQRGDAVHEAPLGGVATDARQLVGIVRRGLGGVTGGRGLLGIRLGRKAKRQHCQGKRREQGNDCLCQRQMPVYTFDTHGRSPLSLSCDDTCPQTRRETSRTKDAADRPRRTSFPL